MYYFDYKYSVFTNPQNIIIKIITNKLQQTQNQKNKNKPARKYIVKKEKTKLSCCRFFYLILLSEKSMKLCQN